MDTFFISYDEPLKEHHWKNIKELVPSAQRVDGIKGFNKAHKTCAQKAASSRFFTIDGDNELIQSTEQLQIPSELIDTDYVFSWSSINSVNGLAYGNGGIKNWPTHLMQNLISHEDCEDPENAIDFCFALKYFQIPDTPSITVINSTPEQAFRAGFREGIKMSLDKGQKIETAPSQLAEVFHRRIFEGNLERLRIWCSVGADVENGLWAIYGARRGCYEVYCNSLDLKLIRDYDWFKHYWTHQIQETISSQQNLYENIQNIGMALEKTLNLHLMLLDAPASRFFKSVYVNRPRRGLMFPC